MSIQMKNNFSDDLQMDSDIGHDLQMDTDVGSDLMTSDLCALQAIDWIEELCEVMVRTHNDMGSSAQEADALQDDNRKFEATASVSRSVPS